MKFKIFFNKYKWDILCNVMFIVAYFLIIFIKSDGFSFTLGSTTDFLTQHYVIPEYFRSLFYETGDLFPDFTFNLGGGQNIYYLSYYGLFSPLIIISYLLPMIEMIDYIIVMMGLVVLGATFLFYFYLRKNNYSYLISFLCSFILLCATPFIFHSHRHIMFVNYMPFLIIAFFGIDRFIEKKKSLLLIISVLLMILSSYYFSISGMIVLFILGIFKYMKKKNCKFKNIIFFSFKVVLRFLVSILISSVLILPTLYTLLNGRGVGGSGYELSELFDINIFMLHDNYSIGLTYICFLGTIFMFFRRGKENRLLSLIILLVSTLPIFCYILNGFLYVSNKVLIPFIPLVLLNIADFLNIIFKNKWFKNSAIVYIILSSFLLCISSNMDEELISNYEVNYNLYEEYSRYVNKIASEEVVRINGTFMNDRYVNKIASINEYKTTIYSSSINKNYRDLYNSLFNNSYPYRSDYIMNTSNNILFQMYMGEKYLITDEKYDYIYEKIDGDNYFNVYKNNYVLPIGYATNKIINTKEFNELEYPENIINMLGRVVTNEKTNIDIIDVDDEKLNFNILSSRNISYEESDDLYVIDSNDDGRITLKVGEDTKDKLIIINFDILKDASCSNGDLGIKINNVENILTCKGWKYPNNNYNFNYVVLGNDDDMLNISFDKGLYKIGNIEMYLVDFNLIKDINKEIDPFILDKNKTKGDKIVGNIEVQEDGYFTLSVPYDKGFNVYVDGEKNDYLKMNGYFIGFEISQGSHEIEIIYEAPLKKVSIFFSLIGIIFCIIGCLFENKKRHI